MSHLAVTAAGTARFMTDGVYTKHAVLFAALRAPMCSEIMRLVVNIVCQTTKLSPENRGSLMPIVRRPLVAIKVDG